MARTVAPPTPLGNVLITGGCGFLGTHIASHILGVFKAPGTTVHILDLRPPRSPLNGATYHTCDLTAAIDLRKVLGQVKPNVVIHTASPVFGGGVSSMGKKGLEMMWTVNVEGTRTLVEESRKAGAAAFVFTSSASVISDSRTDLVNADERWPRVPRKLQHEYYSYTKAEAEAFVLAANSPTSNPPFLTTAIRPSAMFGEADVQMIPPMVDVLRSGRTGFQLGDNDNLFDFTYVGNVAHAHALASEKLLARHGALHAITRAGKTPSEAQVEEPEKTDSRVDGEAFLISNGQPVYFWDFSRSVWCAYSSVSNAQVTASSASAKALPPPSSKIRKLSFNFALFVATLMSWIFALLRLGKPKLAPSSVRYACMTRYFKITKAQRSLGYMPLWTLDEGIQKTVEWFWERELTGNGVEKR